MLVSIVRTVVLASMKCVAAQTCTMRQLSPCSWSRRGPAACNTRSPSFYINHYRRKHGFSTTTLSAAPPLDQVPAELNGNRLQLETALSQLRKNLQLDTETRTQHEVKVSGHGTHLGIDIMWSLRFRPDGAFLEEIVGKHLSFRWGHDGSAVSNCWEVDSSGIPKALEFDDHEAMLLSVWVRSGAWLHPQHQERLDISLLHPDHCLEDTSSSCEEDAGQRDAPPASTSGRGDARSSRNGTSSNGTHSRSSSNGNGISSSSGSNSSSNGHGISSSSISSNGSAHERYVCISIRLKEGRMVAKLRVDAMTWLPVGLSAPLCGDTEIWKYHHWTRWGEGFMFPETVVHVAYAGGQHRYIATAGDILPLAPNPTQSYAIPPCPNPLLDTVYDESVSSLVPAHITRSGHILVELDIDGRRPGYMVLDTGASGFVIESKVAEELQLESFGELYVASVCGKVRSCFRKASSVTMGPLTIRDPVMMAVPLGSLVKGAPGPVVGIVGYDIFRRVAVQIPAQQRPPSYNSRRDSGKPKGAGSRPTVAATPVVSRGGAHAATVNGVRPEAKGGQQQYMLELRRPSTSSEDVDDDEYDWLPIHMVANLPHIEATFKTDDGSQHQGLFMLDSGAGGADVMFHSRAIQELSLLNNRRNNATTTVRGVGGDDATTMRTCSGELPWLQLGSTRFSNVKCLFALSGGLDISLYSCGLFCADLLTRSTVIIDYSRKRFGILKPHPSTPDA